MSMNGQSTVISPASTRKVSSNPGSKVAFNSESNTSANPASGLCWTGCKIGCTLFCMSTAIYLRVSSPKGQKTDSQRAELETWLKRHHYKSVQWFEDHESATTMQR